MNKKNMSIVKSQVFTKGKYIEVLLFADEIIKGHGGRFIAHRKLDRYLARVVYEHDMDNITVVTFYISYADRYFKGGIYEDKILR